MHVKTLTNFIFLMGGSADLQHWQGYSRKQHNYHLKRSLRWLFFTWHRNWKCTTSNPGQPIIFFYLILSSSIEKYIWSKQKKALISMLYVDNTFKIRFLFIHLNFYGDFDFEVDKRKHQSCVKIVYKTERGEFFLCVWGWGVRQQLVWAVPR